jgi:hypothetical protein
MLGAANIGGEDIAGREGAAGIMGAAGIGTVGADDIIWAGGSDTL